MAQGGMQGGQGSAQGRSHVGRGPKGWKRSDERVRDDVSEVLERHHEIDASEIEVKVENGEVTLSGTVEDRRAKRLAEDIIEGMPGVTEVHNQIRVRRS
jgi:osmotically-inducible protein OsmY